MLDEDGLDFFREHAVARDLDHLLGAADEGQVALGIHLALVARPDPAVLERLGGGFGLVPVTLEVAGRAHGDLAHLACGLLGAAVGIDDADRHARHRLAVRAPADGIVRHAGVHGVRFTQAIGCFVADARAPRERLPLLRQRLGKADAEAGDRVALQAGQIEARGIRHLHAGDVHRRDGVPVGHAIAVDRLQHRQRIEAVQQHLRRAREDRHVHAHQHAGDVVQRRHRQRHVLRADAGGSRGHCRLEARVAKAQHRALGQTGGAAGVGHQRDVVDVDRHRRGPFSCPRALLRDLQHVADAVGKRRRGGLQLCRQRQRGRGGQQIGVAHRQHVLQRGLRAHLLDHRQQCVGGDDDARLQVIQLVLQLVRLVERPARAGDGADLLDRVMRQQVLRTVVHEQRHRLSLRHAQRLQVRAERVAPVVELAPADVAAIPDDGRHVRLLARPAAQGFVQGLIGIRRTHAVLLWPRSVPNATSEN